MVQLFDTGADVQQLSPGGQDKCLNTGQTVSSRTHTLQAPPSIHVSEKSLLHIPFTEIKTRKLIILATNPSVKRAGR